MAAADGEKCEESGELEKSGGGFEAGLNFYPRTLGEGRPTDHGSCTPPK